MKFEHIRMKEKNQQISNLNKAITIGIVAGEASGDALGADFMRNMNNLRKGVVWVGVGGQQMQAEGLNSIIDMSRLSVMGLVEVVRHLPDLFKARDEILANFSQQKIDIFIGIDAPDFNLRLGKILKSQGVFCVQYVSPSVWAWREGRIHHIMQATHLVLCLFPFELAVYEKYQHQAVCVGHSLLKNIDKNLLMTDVQQQRQQLILNHNTLRNFFNHYEKSCISHLITVMPGSRRSEIEAILPNMLSAIQKMLIIDEELCFIIPAVNHQYQTIIEEYLKKQPEKVQKQVVVCCEEQQANFSQQVMASSDLILLASGTATLEAMLLNRPMVVVYHLKPLTYWLAKYLVKIPYVALPNILAGKEIVPELIQKQASVDNICRVVQQTLKPMSYQQQLKNLQETTQKLRQQSNISPENAVIDTWLEWQKHKF